METRWRLDQENLARKRPKFSGKIGRDCLGGVLLPHGLENVLHLLTLLLGQVVGSDPFLQELQATLLLTNPGTEIQ